MWYFIKKEREKNLEWQKDMLEQYRAHTYVRVKHQPKVKLEVAELKRLRFS